VIDRSDECFFFSSFLGHRPLPSRKKTSCHGTSREMSRMASDKLKSSEDGPSQGTDLEMISLSMFIIDINKAL